MSALVKATFEDRLVSFGEDAWFNATEAAAHFGKRPIDWLKQKETQEYLAALCKFHKVRENHFIKTRRGKNIGGTWFHPRLAVPFARWCSPEFGVWCDTQIDQLLRGNHPHFDWKRLRSKASSSYKVMNDSLKLARESEGKETRAVHYMTEAKLINWVLTGQFKGLNRDDLPDDDLELMAQLEVRNTLWLAKGVSYQERKRRLWEFAKSQRPQLEAA